MRLLLRLLRLRLLCQMLQWLRCHSSRFHSFVWKFLKLGSSWWWILTRPQEPNRFGCSLRCQETKYHIATKNKLIKVWIQMNFWSQMDLCVSKFLLLRWPMRKQENCNPRCRLLLHICFSCSTEIWSPFRQEMKKTFMEECLKVKKMTWEKQICFFLLDWVYFCNFCIYLLGEFGHVHWLDSSQSRKPFQPFFGLLLHSNNKGILNLAILRQFLS